jgi:hypothetical protein
MRGWEPPSIDPGQPRLGAAYGHAENACHRRIRLVRAVRLACKSPWYQHIAEANPTQQLGADTVRNGIDDLHAVLRRVDVQSNPVATAKMMDSLVMERSSFAVIGWGIALPRR